MSADKLAAAQTMYDSREHTTAKIAEVLGVSRATLYRHLGAARPVKTSTTHGG
jgi:AcrR family transcriptional regulator